MARARSGANPCPGFTAPIATKPRAVPGMGSNPDSSTAPAHTVPLSKGAKKNLKRKEQRKKQRDEQSQESIEQQYNSLVTGQETIEALSERMSVATMSDGQNGPRRAADEDQNERKIKQLRKKLRQIDELDAKIRDGEIARPDKTQLEKLARRQEYENDLAKLLDST